MTTRVAHRRRICRVDLGCHEWDRRWLRGLERHRCRWRGKVTRQRVTLGGKLRRDGRRLEESSRPPISRQVDTRVGVSRRDRRLRGAGLYRVRLIGRRLHGIGRRRREGMRNGRNRGPHRLTLRGLQQRRGRQLSRTEEGRSHRACLGRLHGRLRLHARLLLHGRLWLVRSDRRPFETQGFERAEPRRLRSNLARGPRSRLCRRLPRCLLRLEPGALAEATSVAAQSTPGPVGNSRLRTHTRLLVHAFPSKIRLILTRQT